MTDNSSDGDDLSPVTDGGDDLNNIFRALSSQRRRFVLFYLQQVGQTNLEEVIRYIASLEQNLSGEMRPEGYIQQIRLDLVHTHLGVLQEVGFIEYDGRTNDIVFREPPRLFNVFLYLCALIEKPPSP